MRNIALSFIAALLVGGCASFEEDARNAVLADLPDPYGVTFGDIRRYPGDVLCGRYEANDLSGFRRQRRRFVYYADGVLNNRPDDRQWALFCTAQPAQALLNETGIGPWSEDNAALAKIHADLRALDAAIEAYRDSHGDVPLGRDLRVLVGPEPPLLERLPRDPWGRPYHYRIGLGGRTVRNYTLRTLGADGEPGGRGADADVGREHLPYLNRLQRL